MTREQKIIRAKRPFENSAAEVRRGIFVSRQEPIAADILRYRQGRRRTGARKCLAGPTRPTFSNGLSDLSLEQPAFGQIRIASEVRKRGHSISPAGIRGVWQRHERETMKKRLKALEAKVAQDSLVLTESQLSEGWKAKAKPWSVLMAVGRAS